MDLKFIRMFGTDDLDPMRKYRLAQAILSQVRKPDPGSHFEHATADIRHLDDSTLLLKLQERGYDCILALCDDDLAGLLAYQNRTSYRDSHCFAVRTMPNFRGKGVASQLVAQFLSDRHAAGISKVRLYGGNTRGALSDENAGKIERLYDKACKKQLGLSFSVVAGKDVGYLLLGAKESEQLAFAL